ncbi:hypothetical protein RB653_007443 [Dictyostelium firmibasis]|uniref:EGF-like domain-containing protein n=1 Tax=Dictyostelium firmibasis TaxID=79012 RepID=A0AAN7TLT5_9MYCE
MKLLLSLLLLISIISYSKSCDSNGSCGNSPFTLCKNNVTLLENDGQRIDIDKTNGRILFTIKYGDEFEPRVVSVPLEPSEQANPNNYLKSQNTLYGQTTYTKVIGLIQLVGSVSQDIVIDIERRIAGPTSNIFFPNNTIGNELTWNQIGNFIFKETTNTQYTCWPYSSKIFKGDIGKYNDLGGTLYNGPCGEMKTNDINNDLYIYDGTSVIYKGSLNPSTNGTYIRDLPIVYNETKPYTIKEFDISSTDLYYSNTIDKKIYSVSLADTFGPKKTILSDLPSSFQYYNNFIFYSLNGKIGRVNVVSGLNEILFDSSLNKSHCICAQGFQGESCDHCDQSNNLISWVNGIPRCIPLTSDGNPITCDYDYQCKTGTCREVPISGGVKGC